MSSHDKMQLLTRREKYRQKSKILSTNVKLTSHSFNCDSICAETSKTDRLVNRSKAFTISKILFFRTKQVLNVSTYCGEIPVDHYVAFLQTSFSTSLPVNKASNFTVDYYH